MAVNDLLKNEFLNVARVVCPGFVIDHDNRKVVSDLFDYFTGQPGELDVRKGLWLEGTLGTGKTTLLRVFSQFLVRRGCGFLVHLCPRIAVEYSEGEGLDRYTYGNNCCPPRAVAMGFDELGREMMPVYRYGTSLNVMQYILLTRYSIWQEQGIRTFVTTNCDAEDTERLYGDFIRDKRREMFNIVALIGCSRRQT